MLQELADSSFLPAEKALHEHDAIRFVRTYARKLFAEVAVRIIAYAGDLLVIMFAMIVLSDHVLTFMTVDERFRIAGLVLFAVVYFASFWMSPLRATPLQFLLGMRVLHESGRPLSLREAALRSVALVSLWGVSLFVLRQFFVPGMQFGMIAVVLMLYLPSITARRQGLHDLVARSVIVNKRALRSADDEQRMHAYLADRPLSSGRAARPSIHKMVMDAVVLAIPLFLMMTVIQVSHHKNMYSRIAYAMGEMYETRHLAQAWYEATGDWPKNEAELGRPLRQDYPAGGYYQLEEGGVIRIQFEIRPELKNGSILIEPRVEGGEVTWHCRAVGDIQTRYLPGDCRD